MRDEATFHRGEQAVQKRVGVFERTRAIAERLVHSELPEQHRAFYERLPFVLMGARDASGRPWATALSGAPGFVHSNEPDRLSIHAALTRGDGLAGALEPGDAVGLLGIEFATRRRNRLNGRLRCMLPDHLEIEVGQAFGNCPRYVRPRAWRLEPAVARACDFSRAHALDADLQQRIRSADSFFIATGHPDSCAPDASPAHGMDVSHRGGEAGFVRVDGPNQIVFPDFAGNNHFNTVGNLLVDDRAGLLFVDFETGGMLQLTGSAWIEEADPSGPESTRVQRWVYFDVAEVVDRPGILPLRWCTMET